MGENQNYINELLKKIEILSKKQESFNREILDLKNEIYNLKFTENQKNQSITEEKTVPFIDETINKVEEIPKIIKPTEEEEESVLMSKPESTVKSVVKKIVKPKGKSSLEKFIGENLISKIGIIILIIGVGIGAKYSIDNDLISPLTRIVLGYIMGIGLIGVGIKLKKKYENFSAVLVSGAMAILYFITFLGYSLYDLMPQAMTFGLMVLFTVFTVVAAIQYNKQVIAHIGLVGAYAVPFLLSNGSGQVAVLFAYMAIINFGILFIAIQRYWKPLYYSSFFLTWIIYIAWYVDSYEANAHFGLAVTFLLVFFITFYCIFLLYKLRKKEVFGIGDVILQLINAFVFYGLGLSILNDHPVGEQLLGVFTLANAIVHFIVSVFIYRLKLADKNLFYFTSGMVLIFISIAFPVQLDGNWVTLLWAAEAALLFWIGRTKKVPIYEKLAYPVIAVTFVSLLQDWWLCYIDQPYVSEEIEVPGIPFFNISMLTSLLCAISFGFILYLHRSDKYSFPWPNQKTFYQLISLWISSMFLFALYIGFLLEIIEYLDNLDDLRDEFIGIWLINYTLVFFTVVSFINIKKIKNQIFGYINILLNLFSIFIFLAVGLYLLSELREVYLDSVLIEEGEQSITFYIGIRYISLVFCTGLLITGYQYVRQHFLKNIFPIAYDIVLQITILWIISSELIHWLDMAGNISSDKLGLSILWGVYALLLIVLGFWKKMKHIRFIAFVLFAITLIKLFFYDIADLTTIAKTIVFVSLGILLLIISFLYNKYKHIITDEVKD